MLLYVRSYLCFMTISVIMSIHCIIFEQNKFILFEVEEPNIPGRDESKMKLSYILHLSVFLNAYFPVENNRYQAALKIVEEQLEQISKSHAADNSDGAKLNVFLQAVGNPLFNESVLNMLCVKMNKLQCHMSGHMKEGGEIDTLVKMYQHCGKVPDPRIARATYLHNKGSFHPSQSNNNWRRAMTDAALSKQCSQPPNSTCDVCGLQFAAPPGMFTNLFPGNMFTARCDYVNQLLHPKEYSKRQGDVVRKSFRLREQGRFHFKEKDHNPWVTGLRRYTPEHYIGSHPNIIPCDLSREPDYWYWQSDTLHTANEFEWAMFPRQANFDVSAAADPNLSDFLLNLSNTDKRIRAYTYLAGLIFRHIELYNMTPPLNSWMFDWLPDGKFWRVMVKQHGNSVVDVVTSSDFIRTADAIARIAEGNLH